MNELPGNDDVDKPPARSVAPSPGRMRACDPQQLARRGEQWQGVIEVELLERFASALSAADEPVQWQASFIHETNADGTARVWMALLYSVRAQIACRLCAEPVALEIEEERRFSFAADEDEATRLDEQAADYDVLVAEPKFDLMELIEDELILSLPVLPQHEVCLDQAPNSNGEGPNPVETASEQETQRPFADLARQLGALAQPDSEQDSDAAADLEEGASGRESDTKSNTPLEPRSKGQARRQRRKR